MISHRAVALAGAFLVLSSASTASAAQSCALDADNLHTVPWPEEFGGAPDKMASGALFEPNGMQLLALSNGVLSMVRDPLSTPRAIALAESVVDFTVLPPVDGVSKVAFVNENGLHLSSIAPCGDGEGDEGSTLEFSLLDTAAEWTVVTLLDSAAEGSNVQIVGACGQSVLRGKFSEEWEFSEGVTLGLSFTVTHLAAADAHSNGGVEVAAGDAYSIGFYFQDSSSQSYVTPILAPTGFLQVARIPLGADVRDSFGILERHATTDSLRELVETTFSDPIYSGGLQVSSVDFGAIGTQTVVPFVLGPTDMVFSTTSGDFMALHGVPQLGSGMPFSFDFYNWALLDLASNLEGALLTSTFSVADFDGDGDGDLAVWGDDEGNEFVALVRNDCNVAQPAPTVEMLAPHSDPFLIDNGGGSSITGEPDLGVDVTLEVRQPPVFDGAIPTHVQVKIYVREYHYAAGPPYPIQPEVSPDVWWEDILVVTPGTTTPTVTPHTAELLFAPVQLPMSLGAEPEQLYAENTLIYLELVPQIRTGTGSGAQSGSLVQRANATIWVGSANEQLMDQLICEQEFDEFSGPYCTDTGPHVTYVHRRKVVRYIPPVLNP